MATNESVLEIVIRARNELKETLNDIKKQLEALGVAAGKQTPTVPPVPQATNASFVQLTQGVQKSIQSVGQLADTVRTLGKAFLGLEIVRFISDLAKGAAHEEMLVASMHAVAKSAGIATAAVDNIAKAMRDMGYSTEQAASTMTRFIRADLPIDKFAALAKGARDLALVAGTDAASALGRLTSPFKT